MCTCHPSMRIDEDNQLQQLVGSIAKIVAKIASLPSTERTCLKVINADIGSRQTACWLSAA